MIFSIISQTPSKITVEEIFFKAYICKDKENGNWDNTKEIAKFRNVRSSRESEPELEMKQKLSADGEGRVELGQWKRIKPIHFALERPKSRGNKCY